MAAGKDAASVNSMEQEALNSQSHKASMANNRRFLTALRLEKRSSQILLLLLIVLVILLIIVIVLGARCGGCSSSEPAPVCDSPQCLRTAARIIDGLDTDADPCTDFWQFSCGAWNRNHPIRSTDGDIGVLGLLTKQYLKRSRELVETFPATSDVGLAKWKVRAFYSSCLDVNTVDSEGDVAIKRQIEHLRGWQVLGTWTHQSWEWPKVLRDLHNENGVFPFFSIDVKQDETMPGHNIIQILPSGLGLPDRSYYFRNSTDEVVIAYKQLMKDVAQHLGATNAKAQTLVDTVFHYEKRIAEAMPPDEETQPNGKMQRLTVYELRNLSPQIDWNEHLDTYFRHTRIFDSTSVVTPSKEYLAAVSRILSTTDKLSLNSYLIWTFVFKYARYLSLPYRQAVDNFERVFTGATDSKERWEFCIQETNKIFHSALLSYYIKHDITDKNIYAAAVVYEALTSAFIVNLEEATWMDSRSRMLAMDTVKVMRPRVWMQDFVIPDVTLNEFYRQISIVKSDFLQNILSSTHFRRLQMDLLIRNASQRLPSLLGLTSPRPYYIGTVKELVIPPLVIQNPVFEHHNAASIRFGGLGTLIGNELVSAFDEVGRIYDRNGLAPQTWTNHTSEVYNEHQRCVANTFKHYTLDGLSVNANLTVNDNVAELGGVIQAFEAYQRWVSENTADPPLLGCTYTHDQLFFISYAQSRCSSLRHPHLQNLLLLDSQLPSQMKVMGTLMQVPQFFEAFQCSADSPMRPTQTCTLW